ncbi:MAG: carbohydrate ABC transporter permease [Acutalibacteraceae bacterium]|nr:carbohydrate ABC transporter permease [Acutalibacteraceae bacterium]
MIMASIAKKQMQKSLKSSSKQFSKRFTRSKIGNFFYLFFIILFGVFCVLPLFYCIITSLKPLDEIMVFPPKFFVRRPTLINFMALPELLNGLAVPIERYIFNSLFTSIVTTFLYVFLASMAAFSLSKARFKGRNLIFVLIQLALLFNAYTLGLPQYFIISSMRIIDTYWIYILPQMAATMGVFLTKQYIDGYVADAYLEAAKIDGAGYFRIFTQIVVPIIRPILLTLVLFSFRDIWSYQPSSTIFSEQLKTLPMVTTQIVSAGIARTGSAMAITVIMMVPPIVVYMISQKNVVESMSSAGIKE